ncbi:MAG: 50S ribosomal protein L13 [Synergistaceae bacterium]|nr:50S ribosomal protein L13 [Synergistota bacterium]NLM71502.1 50S ribosomal protein L13 [Synergistaceae bacterium]
MLCNRTYMAVKEKVERKWYIVDAADKPLGRVASHVAKVLTGKNKPTYTPHVDTGDFVIIVNVKKARLTGNKRETSRVTYHTGWPGGFKAISYGDMMDKKPEELMRRIVKGMLPKNKLKYQRKLKVYAGEDHPHSAQRPEPLEV